MMPGPPVVGACVYCGQPAILRARIERADGLLRGLLRRLLHGRAPARWMCSPCLGLQIDRLARRGRR